MEAAAPYFDLNEVKGISISLRTRHQICDFALTILRLFSPSVHKHHGNFCSSKKSRGAFFLEIGNVMCLFGIFSVKSTFFSATPASSSSTSFLHFLKKRLLSTKRTSYLAHFKSVSEMGEMLLRQAHTFS